MRKTLLTAALLLAFSCPALAGEMGTPGAPAPPPQPTSAVQAQTTDGDIVAMSPDSLTRLALDLLAALPSLL
jgi:hypothetical protein